MFLHLLSLLNMYLRVVDVNVKDKTNGKSDSATINTSGKEGSCSKLVTSVTEHLVEVVDKLSTTAVVFFRSERILLRKS